MSIVRVDDGEVELERVEPETAKPAGLRVSIVGIEIARVRALGQKIETMLVETFKTAAGIIPISEIYAYVPYTNIPGVTDIEVLYKQKLFDFEADPTKPEIFRISRSIALKALRLAKELSTNIQFEIAVFESTLGDEDRNAFACRSFNAVYVP